jgi:hypothetical protein
MFILLPIFAFVEASNVRIFNLHRRHGYSRGVVIDSTTENNVTIPYYISIAPDVNISRISGDHSAISLVTSNGELVPIPGTAEDATMEHGCSPEVHHLLPTLRFNLETANLMLLPEDSVILEDDGNCVYLVSETASEDFLVIGRDMLRNAGVLFDYENQRIGFCEPQ